MDSPRITLTSRRAVSPEISFRRCWWALTNMSNRWCRQFTAMPTHIAKRTTLYATSFSRCSVQRQVNCDSKGLAGFAHKAVQSLRRWGGQSRPQHLFDECQWLPTCGAAKTCPQTNTGRTRIRNLFDEFIVRRALCQPTVRYA